MIETQDKMVRGIDDLLEPEAKEVLENKERYENDEEPRFGVESEYGLLKSDRPATHDEREEMGESAAIREALPIYEQPVWNSENHMETHYES